MENRLELFITLLKHHFSILNCDLDITLFGNPFLYLNPEYEASFSIEEDLPFRSANGGFFYLQSTNNTILFLIDTIQTMRERNIDDQLALNIVINLYDKNKEFKWHPLDLWRYQDGRTFFYSNRYIFNYTLCETCIMFHNNWAFGNEAKIYRMKELGLYTYDKEHYYDTTNQKYITYTQIMNGMNHLNQRETFLLLCILSKELNRTLILPKFIIDDLRDRNNELNLKYGLEYLIHKHAYRRWIFTKQIKNFVPTIGGAIPGYNFISKHVSHVYGDSNRRKLWETSLSEVFCIHQFNQFFNQTYKEHTFPKNSNVSPSFKSLFNKVIPINFKEKYADAKSVEDILPDLKIIEDPIIILNQITYNAYLRKYLQNHKWNHHSDLLETRKDGNQSLEIMSEQPAPKEEIKRPKDNALYQNRMKSCQPLFTPLNVIILFGFIGLLFVGLGTSIVISSNSVIEYKITYDGQNSEMSDCQISQANQNKECTISFNIQETMNSPVLVFYELTNFYQNHRQYVNSRSANQLAGESDISISTLKSDCSSKLYEDDDSSKRILNPCGLAANSFFNDVFTLTNSNYQMCEKDISWSIDRTEYKNPSNYMNDANYKWLPESYPQIHATKEDDPNSSAFYGGGIMDEHFIVWMRSAALSTFRKLYGRINTSIPAGTVLSFKVQNNFEVNSFEGSKSLIITSTNWLGGKNPVLGYAYIIVGSISLVFCIVFIIKQIVCPRRLGDMKFITSKMD
ncbi:hypothetical protein WA158_002318 [Blastocystis sp. Blastoise]